MAPVLKIESNMKLDLDSSVVQILTEINESFKKFSNDAPKIIQQKEKTGLTKIRAGKQKGIEDWVKEKGPRGGKEFADKYEKMAKQASKTGNKLDKANADKSLNELKYGLEKLVD